MAQTTKAVAQRTCRRSGCSRRFRPGPKTPGQMYCSPTCRKAASRGDAVKAPKTASDLRKQGSGRVQSLVTYEQSCQEGETRRSEPRTAEPGAGHRKVQGQAAISPGLRKWRRRTVMQSITGIRRCRACARHAIARELGTLTARTDEGKSVGRGQQLCESVWFCGPCESAKAAEDTHELTTAFARWIGRGGTLAVLVLTIRHKRQDRLSDLADALWGARERVDKSTGEVTKRVPGAYQRVLTGSKLRTEMGERVGYIGMARKPELTRSGNGWNLHLNVAMFLGGRLSGTPANGDLVWSDGSKESTEPFDGATPCFEPSEDALEELEKWLHSYWSSTLRSINPAYETTTECQRARCKCGGKGHGVSITIVRSMDDRALIEYLTKAAGESMNSTVINSAKSDMESVKSAAAEVAYSGVKSAGLESMTPFQILDRLWAIEREGIAPEDAPGHGTTDQLRAWWSEYEDALRGRRAFEMTRGLKRHVDLEGLLAEYREDQDRVRLVAGVVLTAAAHEGVHLVESDFRLAELVASGDLTGAVELVSTADDAGTLSEHGRIADESGCAEYVESLREYLRARALRASAEKEARERMDRMRDRLTEDEIREQMAERGYAMQPCFTCQGTGHREEFTQVHDGKCFPCNGTGTVVAEMAADESEE